MICPKCGKENIEGTKCCVECGEKFESINNESDMELFKILQLKQRKKQKRNTIIAITIAILVVFAVIGSLTTKKEDPSTSDSTQTISPKSTDKIQKEPATTADVSSPAEYVPDAEMKYVFTNTKKYIGMNIKLKGEIFINPEYSSDYVCFQMYSDPENQDLNTIVVYGDSSLQLSQGNYVEIDGTIESLFEGSNLLGATITAPQISASSVKIISYKDMFSKTQKEITVNQQINQHGCILSVDKIEFADNETRVYITATNNSKEEMDFYSFNAKLVQGSTQYDEQSNYKSDYPEVNSNILPGIVSSGVIAFPNIDSNSAFTIHLEAHNGNYMLDFNDYLFNIKPN